MFTVAAICRYLVFDGRPNIADWSRLIRNDPSVTEGDATSHSVTNVCDTLRLFVTWDAKFPLCKELVSSFLPWMGLKYAVDVRSRRHSVQCLLVKSVAARSPLGGNSRGRHETGEDISSQPQAAASIRAEI